MPCTPRLTKPWLSALASPARTRKAAARAAKPASTRLQLREKQKVKRLYGLLERQFSNLMKEADRHKANPAQILLQLLRATRSTTSSTAPVSHQVAAPPANW